MADCHRCSERHTRVIGSRPAARRCDPSSWPRSHVVIFDRALSHARELAASERCDVSERLSKVIDANAWQAPTHGSVKRARVPELVAKRVDDETLDRPHRRALSEQAMRPPVNVPATGLTRRAQGDQAIAGVIDVEVASPSLLERVAARAPHPREEAHGSTPDS
jgi:hypothetical protein